jgi:hypothetical protein
LVDSSLKIDYQVDKKCGIEHFQKKIFNFSQLKKRLFFARFSFSVVGYRNGIMDFVIWGLVRFTLARRSAVRTLSSIVNSLHSYKAKQHKKKNAQ